MADALYIKTSTGLVKVDVGEAESGTTRIETVTYSVTETATEAQSYQLGIFAHVIVFVNSVLAVDGDAYGITGGTVLQFNEVLPVGTEVTVIKFITDGSVCPTPSFAIDSTMSTTSENAVQNKIVTAAIKAAILAAHPVGSYYWSSESTNPADLFGGTWTQITDKFIYAAGSKSAGTTGGEENHTLTIAEMAKHGHRVYVWTGGADNTGGYTGQVINPDDNSFATASSGAKLSHNWQSSSFQTWGTILEDGTGDPAGNAGFAGGSAAHNNMPPYLVAYCWRRTA